MSYRLRAYQQKLEDECFEIWRTDPMAAICMVLGTGGGKTATLASIIRRMNVATLCIAHRDSLVEQLSLALARCGIVHRLITNETTRRLIIKKHVEKFGRHFYFENAQVGVAGVMTLLGKRAAQQHGPWLASVRLAVPDEAHHVLRDNTWGRALALMPHAKILGPTATPERADGKGLGLHADGYFTHMVIGPGIGELIRLGYLTPYKVLGSPVHFDRSKLDVSSSTGEFTKQSVRAAIKSSSVVGDVVKEYQRHGAGKLWFTFAIDVETGEEMAEQYRQRGVPAHMLHGDTDIGERDRVLREFGRRQVLQIVNCQLFGEGTDIPALDGASDTAPTESFGNFVQRFGRALRLGVDPQLLEVWEDFTPEQRHELIAASPKPFAYYVDHVGNVRRHGLPERRNTWSLDRRERGGRGRPADVIETTTCLKCLREYERVLPVCPDCGGKIQPRPGARKGPDWVDGEIGELDPETLAFLRGEVAANHAMPLARYGAGQAEAQGLANRHFEKLQALARLKETMDLWAGWRLEQGDSAAMAQRRFYLQFGIDVISAQALKRAEADKLNETVRSYLTKSSISSKVPFIHNEELPA